MAKKTFTQPKIVDAAINLIRREGIQKLSARALAKELGSSTMPVYSTIESMGKLKELIFHKCMEIASGLRQKCHSDDVLTNYAMGHILLAKYEKMLFRLVWLDDSWNRSIVKQMLDKTISRLHQDLLTEGKYNVGKDLPAFNDFLAKIWIVTHGLAVDINIGAFSYDIEHDEFDENIPTVIETLFEDFLTSYRTQ